jgi:hypothetical protein
MLQVGNREGAFMRAAVVGLALLVVAAPASARLWKPTPPQIAQDYATINHNKGAEGRVIVTWMSSPGATVPTMKQLLDKYVVISILHTRQGLGGGAVTWDDIEGVQVTDGNGQPLKEVTEDAMPPTFVGMIAGADAGLRQSTQGKGKMRWSIYEAGAVGACQPGKLVVIYDGESYSFDTPMPGCVKP